MSYEQARKFLERIVPWPEQDEGFINLHYRQDKPMPNGKLPWRGAAAHGIDGIIRELDYRMKRVDTLDMYVCLSSQAQAKPWTKGGLSGMIAVRSKQNAVAMRSFVIDVDVKSTGYATPQDAMRAIAKFIRDTGLPMPTVMVASGTGGYHVYWAVDHNMTLDEWTPVSQAMAEATKKFGFNIDTACTTDAARIMRVPETFNYKQTQRLPVVMGKFQEKDYDIDQIRNPLAMFMRDSAVLAGATGLHPSHSALKNALTPIVGNSAVADNAELATKYDPISIDRVAETCGFVDASLKNGGADNGGLAWNITTLIALFCENSVSDAHRMASGHKLYSSAETDDLIARKRSEKEKHGFGWPSCAAISAAGSRHCATCSNFGKSKSPVHFAVVPSAPVLSPIVAANGLAAPLPRFAHAAPIPDGYSQNDEGRVIYYKILPDGSIEKQIIYPFPMFGVWLQRNPLTLHFTTHVDGGREQAVAFPTLEFSTNDGLSRLLGKHAMFAKTAYSARFKEFLMAWVTRLQETRGGTVASSSFGWIVEEGVTKGFSYGGGLWSPRGKTLSCQPDPVISRQYSPKGQGKPWLQAAKMITGQRRAGLNAILASAFAAPLVMFTGQSGMLLSCFSQESGIGKSTTMKIAQSVWGNPVSAVQSLGDTQASVIKKIGDLKNLPLFWDELKTASETTKFVTSVFQLSMGKEKSRLNSDVTYRESGTWQTLMVSASNDSILGEVVRETKATDAGIARVFEFTLLPGQYGQIEPSVAARVVSKLHDNYGVVGLYYAKWLGENFERIDIDMGVLLKELGKEVATQPSERFWIALIACLLLGATYANELKLTAIDVPQLKRFLLHVLSRMRAEVSVQGVVLTKAANVNDILGRFLAEMRARNTLKTDAVYVAQGRVPKSFAPRILSDTSRLDTIIVQIATETKRLRICRSKIIDWLDDRRISQNIFFAALATHYDMRQITAVLGAGTELAGLPQHVLDIDLAGANMRAILGDE